MAGPAGCLQYFTGEMGRVASFNFPLTATTIPIAPTPVTSNSYINYHFLRSIRLYVHKIPMSTFCNFQKRNVFL